MPVKPSQTAARVLLVLEHIARRQPVGVRELARLVGEDKSAIQRAIVTLAESGWIQPASSQVTRWELTGHIHAVAQIGHGSSDLRRRARPALEDLRDKSGETVLLNVPDKDQFVVIDVVESPHLLRTAPAVGFIVPAGDTATSRALLPYMAAERQVQFLGSAPDKAMIDIFAATRRNGYSMIDDVPARTTNIAAPIFETDGRPVGAVLVSGPTERLKPRKHGIAIMVVETARALSRDAREWAILDSSTMGDRRTPVGG